MLTVTAENIIQKDYNTVCLAALALEHVSARAEQYGLTFHHVWQTEGAFRKIAHALEPFFAKENNPMEKDDYDVLKKALEVIRKPVFQQRGYMYGYPNELAQAAERALAQIVGAIAEVAESPNLELCKINE